MFFQFSKFQKPFQTAFLRFSNCQEILSIRMMSSPPKISKSVKDSNLVWIDCEMTGLNPQVDKLLEIAVIITDKDLNILEEGPNLIINQPKEVRMFTTFIKSFCNPSIK